MCRKPAACLIVYFIPNNNRNVYTSFEYKQFPTNFMILGPSSVRLHWDRFCLRLPFFLISEELSCFV